MFFFIIFQNFLHDLLKRSKKDTEVSEEQLIIYADTMVCQHFCHIGILAGHFLLFTKTICLTTLKVFVLIYNNNLFIYIRIEIYP